MRRLYVILGLLCAMAPSSALPAAAEAPRAEIARLFDTGWDTTSAARSATDRAWSEMPVEIQANIKVGYAYALVLMKQRRYEEAIKSLDAVLQIDPGRLSAREGKIRLLMLTKSYAAALVEINRLAELLAEAPQERVSADRKRESIRFLGRMIGFLEGPAEREVAAVTLRRVRRELESQLSDDELLAYDLARDGVLSRFESVAEKAQTGREDALAEKQERREEGRRELETQRAQQQERAAQLLASADQLRQEMKDNEAEYAKADRPLLDRVTRLSQQAEIPRRELALLLADSDSLRAAALRTKDPLERDRLLFRAQQLDLLAARYDADLVALERQAAAVNAERARLQGQFGRENAALAASMQNIAKELDSLKRGEKRIAMDEKRLDRPVTGGTRAVRALEAEASAFTTYEPLPLEEERQRLLDGLRAAPEGPPQE